MWDTDNKTAFSGPVAVLVNGMSASASEVMAGTLKAYSRALIIGSEKTFGKGSVQTMRGYPFGALKVTKALYLLPNGDAPHNQGVTSHITIPSYENVMGRNYKKYALSPPENGTVTLSPCEEVGESHPYERVKVGDPQKWQSLRALTASDMETLRFFSRQRVAQNADLQQRAFVQPGDSVEEERRGTIAFFLARERARKQKMEEEKKAYQGFLDTHSGYDRLNRRCLLGGCTCG